MTQSLNDLTGNLEDDICEAISQLRHQWTGQQVRLTTVFPYGDKYMGREAIVEGVIPDEQFGALYLCMVQRSDGSGPLNTDGQSRCYRRRHHFEVIKSHQQDKD